MSTSQVEGEPLDPPQALPWYPERLAWQLSFSRAQLRKLVCSPAAVLDIQLHCCPLHAVFLPTQASWVNFCMLWPCRAATRKHYLAVPATQTALWCAARPAVYVWEQGNVAAHSGTCRLPCLSCLQDPSHACCAGSALEKCT